MLTLLLQYNRFVFELAEVFYDIELPLVIIYLLKISSLQYIFICFTNKILLPRLWIFREAMRIIDNEASSMKKI